MFMRLLQLQLDPVHTNEFKDFYENVVFPQLQNMPGCLFAALIKSKPEQNEFISLTFWEEQEQADNYEKTGVFQKLFDQAKPFLSETAEWKMQLSEDMKLEYVQAAEEPNIKKYTVAAKNKEDDKLKIESSEMFIRIVSLKVQEDKLDEFKKIYSNEIIPSLHSVKGCRHAFLTESVNELNEFISVTIWDKIESTDEYERSGKFEDHVNKIRHTLSQFYLWKMALEKNYSAKVTTTDDLKIERYDIISGKSFM
jgi:heme-degrading monooxygenase HmoA